MESSNIAIQCILNLTSQPPKTQPIRTRKVKFHPKSNLFNSPQHCIPELHPKTHQTILDPPLQKTLDSRGTDPTSDTNLNSAQNSKDDRQPYPKSQKQNQESSTLELTSTEAKNPPRKAPLGSAIAPTRDSRKQLRSLLPRDSRICRREEQIGNSRDRWIGETNPSSYRDVRRKEERERIVERSKTN